MGIFFKNPRYLIAIFTNAGQKSEIYFWFGRLFIKMFKSTGSLDCHRDFCLFYSISLHNNTQYIIN